MSNFMKEKMTPVALLVQATCYRPKFTNVFKRKIGIVTWLYLSHAYALDLYRTQMCQELKC